MTTVQITDELIWMLQRHGYTVGLLNGKHYRVTIRNQPKQGHWRVLPNKYSTESKAWFYALKHYYTTHDNQTETASD